MITDKSQAITHPFVFFDNWLLDSELEKIIEYCESQGVEPAKVMNVSGDNVTEDSIRRSSSKLHIPNPDNMFIFEKFRDVANHVNANSYQYDLLGFDYFQYAEYSGDTGDYYNYHIDMALGDELPAGMVMPRKLSFSLILSDPSEYEGGEFEFQWGTKEVLTAEQPKGRLLVFPSWIMHRVKPVTKGIRKSIVVWCVGPRFK